MALAQGEWFLLKQVVEVFSAFLAGTAFPRWIKWKLLARDYQ